jgi:hypothetical protein
MVTPIINQKEKEKYNIKRSSNHNNIKANKKDKEFNKKNSTLNKSNINHLRHIKNKSKENHKGKNSKRANIKKDKRIMDTKPTLDSFHLHRRVNKGKIK